MPTTLSNRISLTFFMRSPMRMKYAVKASVNIT